MVHSLFEDFKTLHVLVIGDVMLDRYCWGDVNRISPEAPVPVVRISNSDSRLGGAANVAINCKALGARVSLATVIGDDEAGDTLLHLLQEGDIGDELIQKSGQRKTTTKTRIMSRSQQMIRLDEESVHYLSVEEEHPFIDACLRFLQIQKPDVVILEDYNKGVLKENVIRKIIAHCRTLKIAVAVDPKYEHFFAYKGVTIFKPNLKEVREGLQLPVKPPEIDVLNEVHLRLKAELGHEVSLITLSEYGMYYADDVHEGILPAHLRSIADVSGAGDTVIAVAAMVYVLTRDVRLTAQCANIAGGLVCETSGVAPIDKDRLIQEAAQLSF